MHEEKESSGVIEAKIVQYIEELLLHYNYTKKDLAENMGVNYQTLMSRFKNKRLRALDVVLISKILNFKAKDVFARSRPPMMYEELKVYELQEEEKSNVYKRVFLSKIAIMLKEHGCTKKKLSQILEYTYPQMMNRFKNCSFTTTDLFVMMKKFNIGFDTFIVPQVRENRIKDFSELRESERTGIQLSNFLNVQNGGIFVEGELVNGYHIYIPYAMHNALLQSLSVSINKLNQEVKELKEEINDKELLLLQEEASNNILAEEQNQKHLDEINLGFAKNKVLDCEMNIILQSLLVKAIHNVTGK